MATARDFVRVVLGGEALRLCQKGRGRTPMHRLAKQCRILPRTELTIVCDSATEEGVLKCFFTGSPFFITLFSSTFDRLGGSHQDVHNQLEDIRRGIDVHPDPGHLLAKLSLRYNSCVSMPLFVLQHDLPQKPHIPRVSGASQQHTVLMLSCSAKHLSHVHTNVPYTYLRLTAVALDVFVLLSHTAPLTQD